MDQLLIIILFVYGLHALLKPLFFILLSYDRRRHALDRAYAARTSATRIGDEFLLLLCLLIVALLIGRGVEQLSFLAGLLVGMTLIQLFFHRFAKPLAEDRAAPLPVSPIKQMSYAIQDQPLRAWKELLLIFLLVGWSLIELASSHWQ